MWRRKVMAHVETWRPYTSLYVGTLALASGVLWQRGIGSPVTAILIFAAPTLGWVAGLYGCDYFDRDLDAIQKGHRPIPSGRISPREAFVSMMVIMYVGFVVSARLSFLNLLLAGVVMAAAVGYTIVKSRALLGNISRGIPGGLTALFGIVAAAGGSVPMQRWILCILLPLIFFFHDMTTNLVGAVRDIEGDRAGQCITLPVKYGVKAAVGVVIGFTVIWEALVGLLPLLVPMRTIDFLLVYLCSLVLAVLAVVTLARNPARRTTALLAHKYFVAERILLASALLAGGAGLLPALLILLPVLAITLWSQRELRDRHEFGQVPPVQVQAGADMSGKVMERV
jgi:geranylgeranylglycerol-phosphate geranylgeranyltransferase